MNDLTIRQNEIISIARQQGRVNVDDLALRFDVTPQTIRKDLNDLCTLRLLNRVHGGAIIASGVENLAYEARRLIAAEEKRAIGAAAAALVPNKSSLFINIGTPMRPPADQWSPRLRTAIALVLQLRCSATMVVSVTESSAKVNLDSSYELFPDTRIFHASVVRLALTSNQPLRNDCRDSPLRNPFAERLKVQKSHLSRAGGGAAPSPVVGAV